MDTMKLLKFGSRNHLIYYALLSIVYLQICNPLSSANVVCDTPDCRKLANYYKKNLNPTTNPCTDFYDYACHGWAAQNPRPKHKFVWGVEQLLAARANMRLREILENEEAHNNTVHQNSKALYRACMNLPVMEISNASTIKTIMSNIGNWPMFPAKSDKKNTPWWQIENQYIAKTGFSSFLEFHFIADLINTHEITILIFAPYSPFGMLKLLTPLHPTLKKHYKNFLTDVINAVAPYSRSTRGATKEIDKDLEDVIEFREKLVEISKTKFTLNGTVIRKIGEFQEWYDKQEPRQEMAKVDWLATIRSFNKNYKDPSGKLIEPTTKMTVELGYFSKLSKVLGQTPKHVIENHIHLYFAESYLKHDAQMTANLEKSIVAGASPTGHIRYETERWEYCVCSHNLGLTLSQMYVLSHFSRQTQLEIEQLLNEEKELLKIRISQSSWLDSETKIKSLDKLDKIQTQIGFPDWYLHGNLVVEQGLVSGQVQVREETQMEILNFFSYLDLDINPTNPGAFYIGMFNRIGVSASYLQWPVYIPNMPYQLKFGGIGTTLGHELSHGFDSIGLQFDAFGKNRTWWSQDMLDKLTVRLDCVEEQFEKYKRQELKKRNITKRPTFRTVNEDVADVMGLKISFMRYKHELQKRNGTCQVLPHFEDFGCDKMFFLAFANLHCEEPIPSAEEANLLADVHSLPRTRVNGAIGNIEEFQQIFNCNPGDRMIQQKRCDIWK